MNLTRGKFSARALIVPLAIVAALGLSTAAHAQRIRLEPNNARGDAAAKALTIINKSGSYVLSKNIVVNRNNVDALDITASNVTLDLQGYTITVASGITGINGINATGQTNVIIQNGIITGFSGAAVLAGQASTIAGITATNNGTGITCGIACLAQDDTVQGNIGEGLIFNDTTGGYLNDILQGNSQTTGGGPAGQVTGGTNLGHNLCNGVLCP
jgi:hypothetical protein